MSNSRRRFIHNASVLAAVSAIPFKNTFSQKVASNEKIGVALIGCNSMGWANLREHIANPEVECVAICDIDKNVLDKRSAELEKLTGKKTLVYGDFRKMLENKDIDAVIIGTPDHWHCLNFVYACQAGKDIYVEKPLANSIYECNIMLETARKHNRVVQVGQWQRSGPHWKSAIEYVKSGKLGKISMVKNWLANNGAKEMKVVPDSAAPAGVDYTMWLGPAPQRAFNENRYHGKWRYFWDYGGGVMSDWGVHLLDMAFNGMNASSPVSVLSTGGKYSFPESAMETPDNQVTIYDFGNYAITWEHTTSVTPGLYGNNYCGVAFTGDKGTLVVDRDKWRLIPEISDGRYEVEALPEQRGSGKDLTLHVRNFLDCIKSRNKPECDIEIARNVAINAHLGNIALKTGRKVYWDTTSNSFRNDSEANRYIKPVYNNGWKLPE